MKYINIIKDVIYQTEIIFILQLIEKKQLKIQRVLRESTKTIKKRMDWMEKKCKNSEIQ